MPTHELNLWERYMMKNCCNRFGNMLMLICMDMKWEERTLRYWKHLEARI